MIRSAPLTAPPPGYIDINNITQRNRPGKDKRRFIPEPWSEIAFDGKEEWLIKHILPRCGVAAIYGQSGSFKSFITGHLALCVALGRAWAGRRVTQASVVYIAAEGASGLRKRKAAYAQASDDLPAEIPFYLISATPNLGADPGDLEVLIADIAAAGVSPGLVVLDTLAQTLGSNDENGPGMTAFNRNASALSTRFNCLILIIHHVGLGEGAQQRMRGHSSLRGALDAMILCERTEGEMAANLTLQKIKDESSNLKLSARLSRVVLGHDEDGDEISTLIVDDVVNADAPAEKPKAKQIATSLRMLIAVVKIALDNHGAEFQPFGGSGPRVRAVTEQHVQEGYFARIAEKAEPGEDPDKLHNRQRMSFRRAIESALKSETLFAAERIGERHLWQA